MMVLVDHLTVNSNQYNYFDRLLLQVTNVRLNHRTRSQLIDHCIRKTKLHERILQETNIEEVHGNLSSITVSERVKAKDFDLNLLIPPPPRRILRPCKQLPDADWGGVAVSGITN